MTGLDVFFVGWLGIAGLAIGSFLNVVIARVPEGRSIVTPRSQCPKCQSFIAWYDNVPVVSWLVLRGRCRGCGAPISARYAIVELLTGTLFLLCLWRFGWTYPLAKALVLVSVLVPLVFIDAEHWILPFEITLPGIAAGLLMSIPQGHGEVVRAILGASIAFLAFRAMEYFGWLAFRKEALGGGDKFLFALVGAFVGPSSLLAVVFLSSLQGAVVGLSRLALTGKAGPQAPSASPDGAQGAASEEAPPTFTWDFLRPNLQWTRRLALVIPSLLIQPIPDDPPQVDGDVPEWVPGPTNLPFGPWIALAGVEVLLAGEWLASALGPYSILLGPAR